MVLQLVVMTSISKSIQVFATEYFELKLQLVQQLLLLTKLARKLIRRRRNK
jgi:hypothetical protein